jgi:hypothetical protein
LITEVIANVEQFEVDDELKVFNQVKDLASVQDLIQKNYCINEEEPDFQFVRCQLHIHLFLDPRLY